MKKKILAVTILSMLLSFSGCGAVEEKPDNVATEENAGVSAEDDGMEEPKETQEATAEPSGEVEETPEATKEPQEEDSKDLQDTEQPQATPEPSVAIKYLDVTFDYFYDSYFDEVSMMYGRYNTIQLHTVEYPELTAAVNAYNEEHARASQGYLDDLEKWATEEYKEYGPEMFMGPYYSQEDMFLRRADSQVLSVLEQGHSYSGGAHGSSYFSSLNFDVQTGKEIELASVIKDVDSLPKALATEVKEKYPDLSFWTDDVEGLFREYITPSDPAYAPAFTWTLDYEGVTFYFSDYELGSYVDGTQQVTVSYSEYPGILEEKYFANIASDYVLPLPDSWRCSDVDLNGDGVTDYISVKRDYSGGIDFSESYDVTVNGNTYTQETYCYDLDVYLVKSAGSNYLYVQRTIENDYQSACVFAITENSVEYVGEFAGGFGSFTNSLDFEVMKRVDMLSTYFVKADCYVGENGMPEEIGGVYTINGEFVITSVVDISADLTDESGNLLGTSYIFPAGTSFQLMATDGATYVDVLAGDGQRCRFYTTPEWPQTVNGMDADSCFETLWYAG